MIGDQISMPNAYTLVLTYLACLILISCKVGDLGTSKRATSEAAEQVNHLRLKQGHTKHKKSPGVNLSFLWEAVYDSFTLWYVFLPEPFFFLASAILFLVIL